MAFEIARANAELLSSEAGAAAGPADPSSSQSLAQQQAQLDAQRQSIQKEIGAGRQMAAARGKARQDIDAKLPELQGELAMVDARKNLLDTMAEFVSQSDPKGAGASALKAHIDAIAGDRADFDRQSAGQSAGQCGRQFFGRTVRHGNIGPE